MKKSEWSLTFFITRILFALLCLFLVFVLVRVFAKKYFIDHKHTQNAFTRFIYFDTTFDLSGLTQVENISVLNDTTDLKPESTLSENNDVSTLMSKFNTQVVSLESKITENLKASIPYRVQIIQTYNNIQRGFGWDILPENRFRLEGGYLTSISGFHDASEYLENMNSLKQYLDDLGISLLYVQVPPKNAREDSFPGETDYSNINADNFISGLDEIGVDYLDLRIWVEENGWINKDLFYKTDHHWTQKSALQATHEVASFLNNEYGYEIDLSLYSIAAYDEEVFPDLSLGSHGRAVTRAYSDPEDFSILHPMFPTQFSYKIPSKKIDVSGSFDVTYNYDCLDPNGDPYVQSCYETFSYADRPVVRFHNELNSSGKRILVIKCSFANPLLQFLALGIEDLDAIDLRHFDESLLDFITESRPDIVMFVYGTPSLAGNVHEFFTFK